MKTNKKVIRKPKLPNQFTSIHNSILNDKRLSSNAFRLISSILSDNDDTFKLSQTTYCNRLGWEPTMFKRAIENLIECGYVNRILIDTEIPGIKKAGSKKKIYFYTVSEYGNLEKEPSTEKEAPESTIITQPIPEVQKEEIVSEIEEKDFIRVKFESEMKYSKDSPIPPAQFHTLTNDYFLDKLPYKNFTGLKSNDFEGFWNRLQELHKLVNQKELV